MESKKGAINVDFVVATVLVIFGFVIVLIIYSILAPGPMANKEVCHQSVILRGTVPALEGAKTYVPLTCKTEKICITAGSSDNDCEDFENEAGVTKVKVRSVADVEKTIAQNYIDCWSMMGEGKLSLFNQWFAQTYGLTDVYSSCVICNRIAFNYDKLIAANVDLSKMNVFNYMASHQMPGEDVSYYEYLLKNGGSLPILKQDAFNKINTFKKGDDVIVNSLSGETVESRDAKIIEDLGNNMYKVQYYYIDENNKERKLGEEIEDVSADRIKKVEVTQLPEADIQGYINDPKNQQKEMAILFMQIAAPKQGGVLKNSLEAVGLTLGASFVTAPVSTTRGAVQIGKLCLSGGWVGPVICTVLAVAGVGYQQINTAYNRAVTAGYCGDVAVTGGDARDGCSATRIVDYNLSSIRQYCKVIENVA